MRCILAGIDAEVKKIDFHPARFIRLPALRADGVNLEPPEREQKWL
jgi:hypothetical protein